MRSDSQFSVLGRMMWMVIGPAVMALCLVAIFNLQDSRWFTVPDGLFGLALVATLAGRWMEFQGNDPRTSTFEPATPAHLRRYLLVAAPAGILIWLAVKLLSNRI